MSKLYEEALVDIRKVKQLAEENAKRAVLEAVVPRIREMIESELMADDLEDEAKGAPGSPNLPGELITDVDGDNVVNIEDVVSPNPVAISNPDEDGKVTLDIDALGPETVLPVIAEPVDELVFGDDLAPVIKKVADVAEPPVVISVESISRAVNNAAKAGKIASIRSSKSYNEQICKLTSQVKNTYDSVQNSTIEEAKKNELIKTLETCSRVLQETMKIMKNQLKEADVTMTLTGLPDDVDLGALGVDLVAGEEEAEVVEAPEAGEQVGDELGDELDLDVPEEGPEEGAEDQEVQEGEELTDDTVVEIDEGMLRREIARMRKINEETKPQSWGHGAGDVDGWSDEGEPLEMVVEEDEQDEDEQLDEQDDLDEYQNRRNADEFGTKAADDHTMPVESVKREKLLQKRISSKIAEVKAAYKAAKIANKAKQVQEAKEQYIRLSARLAESKKRETKALAEQKSDQSGQSRPVKPAADLHAKLAESNLLNVKLLCTNKVLQTSLTETQKNAVARKLESAKTIAEAKAIYKKAMSYVKQNTLDESRIAGSSSRPVSSASLTESVEVDRWAVIAGITR